MGNKTLKEHLIKVILDKKPETPRPDVEKIVAGWLKVNDIYKPDWGWDTIPVHLRTHIDRVFMYYLDRVL